MTHCILPAREHCDIVNGNFARAVVRNRDEA